MTTFIKSFIDEVKGLLNHSVHRLFILTAKPLVRNTEKSPNLIFSERKYEQCHIIMVVHNATLWRPLSTELAKFQVCRYHIYFATIQNWATSLTEGDNSS